MTNTYTIPEVKRTDVEKLITRNQKKAARYGTPLTATYGTPYAKEVNVWRVDPVTDMMFVDRTMLVECFDLTIESEIIRNEGFTVAAKIEHLDGGNVVYPFGCECKQEWTTLKPHCDHCNGNHGQRVTFIVRDTEGNERQIGRTCLKEYCGIDPQAIGTANALHEILEGMDEAHYDFDGEPLVPALYTDDVIALAVMLYRTKGYTPSRDFHSNKDMLNDLIHNNAHAEERDAVAADTLISAVKAMSKDEAFDANLDNVKTLIDCGYCKVSHLGYIAYAPLAYERYMQRKAEKDARAQMRVAEKNSEYIGEIGKRMDIEIADMALVTSWETQFGWTYLYKFHDKDGNVLMWFASKIFGYWTNDGRHYVEYTDLKRIKATVKDHNERDGVKQTIITRCVAA